MHLLIAIPKAAIRNTIQLFLTKQGYTVHAVENGLEAEDALKAKKFQLVIAEEYLPYRNGLELIRMAREHAIPTLIIGDTPSEAKVMEAFELGAADFMVKPYTLGELHARAKNILNHYQL